MGYIIFNKRYFRKKIESSNLITSLTLQCMIKITTKILFLCHSYQTEIRSKMTMTKKIKY